MENRTLINWPAYFVYEKIRDGLVNIHNIDWKVILENSMDFNEIYINYKLGK